MTTKFPVGVFVENAFDSGVDYFEEITKAHQFQSLTESNKEGQAYRTGIYLTPVVEDEEGLHFHLLRCSTNFRDGPTENFRDIDQSIVTRADQLRAIHYPFHATLNHVLAQIYNNDKKKARIGPHSDKTKDMPVNGTGMLAFCTFYKNDGRGDEYKGISRLMTLRFRLKKDTAEVLPSPLAEMLRDFDVTLTRNSLYLFPILFNRLYTHEVAPSPIQADMALTRLGYVIRCSSTPAVHCDGKTYIIKQDGQRVLLEQPTEEGIARLKELYRKENLTSTPVEYGDEFNFSLNAGDYLAPVL